MAERIEALPLGSVAEGDKVVVVPGAAVGQSQQVAVLHSLRLASAAALAQAGAWTVFVSPWRAAVGHPAAVAHDLDACADFFSVQARLSARVGSGAAGVVGSIWQVPLDDAHFAASSNSVYLNLPASGLDTGFDFDNDAVGGSASARQIPLASCDIRVIVACWSAAD